MSSILRICITYSTAVSLYEITARGESRVANIARGEAECYIFVMRPSPRAVYFIQTKQQCFT